MRLAFLAPVALVMLFGCAPDKNTPLGEIPKLTDLGDVMDNQKTAADPEFAKMGAATFTDADFAGFAQASERIQATSLKSKEFSKGRAEFEALAMKVNEKAKALGAAAATKDAAGAKTALTDMKAACKECHSKFR